MEKKVAEDPIRILILEDSTIDAELIGMELQKIDLNFESKLVSRRKEFIDALQDYQPNIILSDYKLPDFDGKEALKIVQKDYPDIPVIIVTGAFSDIDAVEFLTTGARDYILKDRLARLAPAIKRVLQTNETELERKKAEKALRESEEKYRNLFEGSQDAIMLLHQNHFFDCNSQTLNLFGLTGKNEFISKSPDDFSPPLQPDGKSSQTASLEKINEALIKGTNSFEWIHQRKNGETFHADVLLSAIHYKGEKVIQATVRDITERKNAQARIEHLDRLLRSIRGINLLITHESDKDKLLQTACNLLHKVGGYKMTWIALISGDNLVVEAQSGADPAIPLKQIQNWDYETWKEAIEHDECNLKITNSCANVLLITNKIAYGTLNICFYDGLNFDTEEQSLIKEVAEDIAFALYSIEIRHQRKLAEETLKKSEAGLAQAQRIAHLGNWDLDLVQNILTWSAEIYRIFEIDPEKFGASYEAFLNAIHPDDRDLVNRVYTESVNNRKPYNIIHRLKMRDDRIKYVREQCETYYENDGKPLRSIGTVHDITDQILAQQALEESLTRYSIVTESANDAIIGMKPDGTIHLWNKMAQQMFGYSSSEALGKLLHLLIVPEKYREQVSKGIEKFVQTGEGKVIGKTLEMTALRRDQTEFPVEISISAMNIGGYWHATGIIRDITERLEAEKERLAHEQILERTLMQTIEAIAATVEARDPYTAGHQRRVAVLASAISQEMGQSPEFIHAIYLIASIHDLGKIHLPAEILNKPGHLKPVEFELIKSHPQVGYDILKDVQFPWPVSQIVLQHHERLNGTGYPHGLSGNQISTEAKILAVADVVEAMSSHRPYRPSLGIDVALEEISLQRGVLYDEKIVDACLVLFREKGFTFQT